MPAECSLVLVGMYSFRLLNGHIDCSSWIQWEESDTSGEHLRPIRDRQAFIISRSLSSLPLSLHPVPSHNWLFVPCVNSSASLWFPDHSMPPNRWSLCLCLCTGDTSPHKPWSRRLASLISNPFTETSISQKSQQLRKRFTIASQKCWYV